LDQQGDEQLADGSGSAAPPASQLLQRLGFLRVRGFGQPDKGLVQIANGLVHGRLVLFELLQQIFPIDAFPAPQAPSADQ
jgi:hypothetical protein